MTEKIKFDDKKKYNLLEDFSGIKNIIDIERSIIKRYRKEIWSPFTKAIRDFELIKEGDKIACCISGGKDSLLLAKLMQELKRHSKIKFEIEFIAMDPGYRKDLRERLEKNLEILNIDCKIFDTDIFDITEEISSEYPCYMCARMRRGSLYGFAEKLGVNKIALGHHFNDVIETILLNIFYTGSFKTMLPKLKSKNFNNMELIRPLYYIEEKDIIRFIEYTGVKALDCACKVAAKKTGSKRAEIKYLIEDLKEKIPNSDKNILKSSENVYKNIILGYIDNDGKHSYLEDY